jgi:hypothetical protein
LSIDLVINYFTTTEKLLAQLFLLSFLFNFWLGLCSAFARPLLGLCSVFARPLLDFCSAFARPLLSLCSAFAQPLLSICSAFATFARPLLDLCSPFAQQNCSAKLLSKIAQLNVP